MKHLARRVRQRLGRGPLGRIKRRLWAAARRARGDGTASAADPTTTPATTGQSTITGHPAFAGLVAHSLVAHSLGASDPRGTTMPTAVLFWPVDNANPYQSLLYCRFPAHNLVPLPLSRIDSADAAIAELPAGVPIVLHVHWLYGVIAGSRDVDEAEQRVTRFEQTLRRVRQHQRLSLLWTVHNLLPHETLYPEAERRLRRVMLTQSDVVHVMRPEHVDLLEHEFGHRPARVVVAAHPSFAGAYPDWADQRTARAALGLAFDARVLVTFGQIRPYKGHALFFDVFERAHRLDPSLRWLVSGRAHDLPETREFLRRARAHPAVLTHPTFIPVTDAHLHLRAAGAMVLPYRNALNSGSAALAATFDLPVYASAGVDLDGLVPEAAIRRLDLTDPQGAAEVLARPWGDDRLRDRIRAHATEIAPAVVSAAFARELRAIRAQSCQARSDCADT